MLLFLMMATLSMMPRNVWGEEIYMSTDKDGTIVITNKPPQENINSNTKKSNSYEDSTPDERLHWGRDNALIDEQKKGKNVTTSNISYLIQYGRIKKIGENAIRQFRQKCRTSIRNKHNSSPPINIDIIPPICSLYYLDIQDRYSYSSTMNKKCLLKYQKLRNMINN